MKSITLLGIIMLLALAGVCTGANPYVKPVFNLKQNNYQPARFEGGDATVRAYILSHMLIKPNPQTDHQADIKFDITENGTMVNFTVDGNISMQLTMDLKNLLKAMHFKLHPIPAKQNGQPVKSQYAITIKFN